MATELLPAVLGGAMTTTQQVYTGACKITCLGVFTNGADDFKITLYDGTADTDKKIWETKVVGADNYGGRVWMIPGGINTGIYAVVTGANGWFVVEYIKSQT